MRSKTRLTESDIGARIRMGKAHMERFVSMDKLACARFRDPTAQIADVDGTASYVNAIDGITPYTLSDTVAVGHGSSFAINMLVKLAYIGIADPDWHIEGPGHDQVESARQYMRKRWRINGVKRAVLQAAMKRHMVGLGILAFRWDQEIGPVFEHVPSWEFFVDPHVRDWERPKWAGRVVKMTKREARDRYGEDDFPLGADSAEYALDSDLVAVDLYWDKETEAHYYNGKWLNEQDSENLYGQIPLLIMEGDPDPGTGPYPIGDYQMTLGLQQEVTDLTQQIHNIAVFGGPMNLVNEQLVSKSVEDALASSREQGYIAVRDAPERAFVRIPGEELPAAVLEAKRDAEVRLDSMMGVTQYQRGAVTNPARYASEAMLVTQQSGSRGGIAKAEYEAYLDRVGEVMMWLSVAFGGPDENDPEQDMTAAEQWFHLQSITSIHVVDGSTVYRDPMADQQQCMQLLQLMSQLTPLMMQSGYTSVPNLEAYVNDALVAFNRPDKAKYWKEQQAPQAPGQDPQAQLLQQMQQQAQMPAGGPQSPGDASQLSEGGAMPPDAQSASQGLPVPATVV